jgi:hypothetical protein
MPRCASCNGVVTKHDVVCYGCGDPIPRVKRPWQPKRISKISNIAFFASLGLTAFCFLLPGRMSLTVSIALSSLLLIVRMIADRAANKNSDPKIY